jgi:hypothetical protein
MREDSNLSHLFIVPDSCYQLLVPVVQADKADIPQGISYDRQTPKHTIVSTIYVCSRSPRLV